MSIPIISIAQMRSWEAAAWAAGQSEAEVIRRVGHQAALLALRMTRPGDWLLLLAGKGHNGDDVRAIQPHLAGRGVEVLNLNNPAADFPRLEALLSHLPDLVVDGLFGIGLNRPLDADWLRVIERINRNGSPVLSLDVPSGLNADTGLPLGGAICAAATLTVGAPKAGLLTQAAWPFVGRLEVTSDAGLGTCPCTAEFQWTQPGDFAGFPPPRDVSSHKGSFGHLCILAGSLGFHGAAVLAARGAQRAQPGLISLRTQEAVYPLAASHLQAVMVAPWRPGAALPGNATAFLMGPGLAAPDIPEGLKAEVRRLWRESALPVIADATALDWLEPGDVPADALRVLTPHPGEAARLLGVSTGEIQAGRLEALRQLSRRYGQAWVVLKGHQTLIGRATGAVYANGSGNPYLAQGGSGDLLAGYLSGLLAQPSLRSQPLQTLRFAAWQHGAAADRLQSTQRNWVVEELARELGLADCVQRPEQASSSRCQ